MLGANHVCCNHFAPVFLILLHISLHLGHTQSLLVGILYFTTSSQQAVERIDHSHSSDAHKYTTNGFIFVTEIFV